MSVANPAIPVVQEVMPNAKEHRRQIAQAINQSQSGRIRCTLDVTLTANSSTTTVIDSRIGYYSVLRCMPMTANAASEAMSGNM